MNERNDDWIDRALRADALAATDDAAFTRRVLAALPAPTPRAWLKPALVLGSTALGGALAAILDPYGTVVIDGIYHIAYRTGFTPAVGATLTLAVVLAVSGYILATDE